MSTPNELTNDSQAIASFLKGEQAPAPTPKTAQHYINKALHSLCEESVDTEFGNLITEEAAAEAIRLAVADERVSREHGGGVNHTTF